MNVDVKLENPNVVFVSLRGSLEEEDIDEMYDKMEEYADKVGTIDLLADMTELTGIPPKTREKVKNRGKSFTNFNNIGLFGAKPAVRVLGSLLLKILPIGKGDTKFFKTVDEARTWLAKNKQGG